MSIKRYDFDCSLGGDGLTEDDCGAWVQHADHLAAVAAARREALEEAAKACSDKTVGLFDHAKGPYLSCASAIRALAQKEAPLG